MTVRQLRRGVALIVLAGLVVCGRLIEAQAQVTDELAAVREQVRSLHGQGKYADALTLAERYVSLARHRHGEEHTEFLAALSWLGSIYQAQGRNAEAEAQYQRALAVSEKVLGPAHPDVGTLLSNLAGLHQAQGRYADAEPLYWRALAISERARGPDHPDIGIRLNNLASLHHAQGRYADAEPLYVRALAITEKALGPDHPDVGIRLNNLAGLYHAQNRYGEAEALYQRNTAIVQKALGPDHPLVSRSLINLADLYLDQGRHVEAEPLYRRSLAISEKAVDHLSIAAVLNSLAELCRAQGRDAEAEPLFRRALGMTEKTLGTDHLQVGKVLSGLAKLFHSQDRYADAEPLYKRNLSIYENLLGADHPAVGTILSSLGALQRAQARYAEAEPPIQRALAIAEKALGPDHRDVAAALNNLADLYQTQTRYAEAEPLYRRAILILEKALGPDHSDLATLFNNLGLLHWAQDHYTEVEPLFQRANAIYEKALGLDHPDVGTSLNNLARLYFAQGDWARAADFWRRSTALLVRRTQRGAHDVGKPLTGKTKSEVEVRSAEFWSLIKAAHRLVSEGRSPEPALLSEMFQAAQWAQASEAAQALAQTAARQAKGMGALAGLVRERQDLVGEWRRHDKLVVAAVSRPADRRNTLAENEHRTRLTAIDTRIAEIDKLLTTDFPDYAALANPVPLSVEYVQSQLRSNEALILVLDTPELKPLLEETFIWVVTKTDSRWVRSELGTPSLKREVEALRCGLDATLWSGGDSRDWCVDLVKAHPFQVNINGQAADVLPFDLERAHLLYKSLLGSVEELIKGKHLLIVPSGPLTSVPFHVLVTEPSKTRSPRELVEYRKVAWLGTRQPISVLPSVASLKALRQFAKTSSARKTYLAIGNPLLDGPQGDPRWGGHYKKQAEIALSKQQCPKTRTLRVAHARAGPLVGFAKLFRAGQADIEEVRSWTPLPETADELCEVGRRLGVPESDILLGSRATEATLKELSGNGRLAEYKILHFATHGALTGLVQGSAEPGLILTPPARGTTDSRALERDDGFLTASEIASLKLDADWVILSACNTAGPSGETAEPLSGMARAFFYAGARALLVSHWEVGSDSAVKLTTRAFAELKSNPRLGRADAFRISMLELIEKGTAFEAHPSQWAPFVVVGEGAAAR